MNYFYYYLFFLSSIDFPSRLGCYSFIHSAEEKWLMPKSFLLQQPTHLSFSRAKFDCGLSEIELAGFETSVSVSNPFPQKERIKKAGFIHLVYFIQTRRVFIQSFNYLLV